jgi:bacteriocin-like protein
MNPSKPSTVSTGEMLSNDELQQISGGVAYATGRPAGPGLPDLGRFGGMKFPPVGHLSCLSGGRLPVISDPRINNVLSAGLR